MPPVTRPTAAIPDQCQCPCGVSKGDREQKREDESISKSKSIKYCMECVEERQVGGTLGGEPITVPASKNQKPYGVPSTMEDPSPGGTLVTWRPECDGRWRKKREFKGMHFIDLIMSRSRRSFDSLHASNAQSGFQAAFLVLGLMSWRCFEFPICTCTVDRGLSLCFSVSISRVICAKDARNSRPNQNTPKHTTQIKKHKTSMPMST